MIDSETIAALLPEAFENSSLPISGRKTGKVRDWYSLPDGHRLIITTDRLSAFDRNLAVVPYKGQVLNQLSAWWFSHTRDIIGNHMLSIPDPNGLIALEVEPIPVEVIVRGFITGVTTTALWYLYSQGEREIYGYSFPEGLRKNQALPKPIITPTTKGGASGHDERLTCREVVETGLLDDKTWDFVQNAALELFKRGQEQAASSGILLVDTKYEFGRLKDGTVLLIDEVHTPDSSRFWKAESYLERFERGEEPQNYDKEFIRLAYSELGYRGDGLPPVVPSNLWVAASRRYIEIYELLTGSRFDAGEYPVATRLEKNLKKAGIL
jgi:phosphoribosylaminoimidazole-succinocarboxamide synthase